MRRTLVHALFWIVLGSALALRVLAQSTAQNLMERAQATQELEPIIKLGKRHGEWFKIINAHRPPSKKIQLVRATHESYNPPERPLFFNLKSIEHDFQKLLESMPKSMRAVLESEGSLPIDPPVSDRQYAQSAYYIDQSYSDAIRFIELIGEKSFYIEKGRKADVRGYLFFNRQADAISILRHWDALNADQRGIYRGWLINLCDNGPFTHKKCVERIDQELQSAQIVNDFSQLMEWGKVKYDSAFKIGKKLAGVVWNSREPGRMHVPFRRIDGDDLLRFFSSSIAGYWRHDSWRVVLDYQAGKADLPFLKFEKGISAEADLGGPEIALSSDDDLGDIATIQTAQHEFGHLLGFTDCYVELYDEEMQSFVNYDLVRSNIMCGPRSTMTEDQFRELKRVYFQD